MEERKITRFTVPGFNEDYCGYEDIPINWSGLYQDNKMYIASIQEVSTDNFSVVIRKADEYEFQNHIGGWCMAELPPHAKIPSSSLYFQGEVNTINDAIKLVVDTLSNIAK